MIIEARGRILRELSRKEGSTRKGKDYECREYLLEEQGINRRKLKFQIISYDGPIDQPLQEGWDVTIRCTVEAREYNGKWYNNIEAYSVQVHTAEGGHSHGR